MLDVHSKRNLLESMTKMNALRNVEKNQIANGYLTMSLLKHVIYIMEKKILDVKKMVETTIYLHKENVLLNVPKKKDNARYILSSSLEPKSRIYLKVLTDQGLFFCVTMGTLTTLMTLTILKTLRDSKDCENCDDSDNYIIFMSLFVTGRQCRC